MVNAAVVNAESHIFRPPLFANFLPFSVEFYNSKIRLNILASFEVNQFQG